MIIYQSILKHLNEYTDMLDSTNSDPDFMNTIITGDEFWVYGYDPETKSFRHFPYIEYPDETIKHYLAKIRLTINLCY